MKQNLFSFFLFSSTFALLHLLIHSMIYVRAYNAPHSAIATKEKEREREIAMSKEKNHERASKPNTQIKCDKLPGEWISKKNPNQKVWYTQTMTRSHRELRTLSHHYRSMLCNLSCSLLLNSNQIIWKLFASLWSLFFALQNEFQLN